MANARKLKSGNHRVLTYCGRDENGKRMLDRLLHHAHVVNIRDDTYRLKDRRKSGVYLTPPATIPAVG